MGQKKDPLLYGGKDFNAWRETLLTDLKPEVRVEAINALGAFSANGYAEEATTVILDVMRKYDYLTYDSEDGKVIQAGQNALAKIGPTAIVTLAKELSSNKVADRRFAIDTLSAMIRGFPKKTFPLLFVALKDDDPGVRFAAIRSIVFLSSYHEGFVASLTAAEKQGIAVPLVEQFGYADLGEIAATAVIALGPEAKLAVPSLSKALKNKEAGVRKLAYSTIDKLGSVAFEGTIPAMIAIVKEDVNTEIRTNAIDALGRIGPPGKDAVPALIKLVVQHPTNQLGQHAVVALGKIGPGAKEAVPILIALVKGRAAGPAGGEAGRGAVVALGKIGPAAKEAVPALIAELLRSTPDSLGKIGAKKGGAIGSTFIIAALGEIGPAAKEAVPGLIRCLQEDTKGNNMVAAKALGQMGPEAREAVPALKGLLDRTPEHGTIQDEELRKTVIEALEKITR